MDYKEYSYEPFTKYVNVAKWLKSKGLGFSKITFSGSDPVFADYPQTLGTLIVVGAGGFATNQILGWVTCTWYVAYKSTKVAA